MCVCVCERTCVCVSMHVKEETKLWRDKRIQAFGGGTIPSTHINISFWHHCVSHGRITYNNNNGNVDPHCTTFLKWFKNHCFRSFKAFWWKGIDIRIRRTLGQTWALSLELVLGSFIFMSFFSNRVGLKIFPLYSLWKN